MPIWTPIIIVAISGAVGGALNAIITDNGFIMPRREHLDSATVLRPGFLGNVFTGAVAAFLSWGLYGPYSIIPIFGEGDAVGVEITLSTIAGAILVGIGGSRVLTSEVDKRLLRVAASTAAATCASTDRALEITSARPAQAFQIAKEMLISERGSGDDGEDRGEE